MTGHTRINHSPGSFIVNTLIHAFVPLVELNKTNARIPLSKNRKISFGLVDSMFINKSKSPMYPKNPSRLMKSIDSSFACTTSLGSDSNSPVTRIEYPKKSIVAGTIADKSKMNRNILEY